MPATATRTVSLTVSSSTAVYCFISFVCSFEFRSFLNSRKFISSFIYSSFIDDSFNNSRPSFSSKQVDTLDMDASQEQGKRKKKETK